MNGDKFACMIGFAKRAGRIVIGYDALKTAKRIKLLAVDDSASASLTDNMKILSRKLDVPLVYAAELETLVGAGIKAIGVTDANMAREMETYARSGAPNYHI